MKKIFCRLFLLLSVVCSTTETKSSPINLPDSLRGNWLMTDGSNGWAYGLYDNFAIADNKFWTYEKLEGDNKRAKLRLRADDGTKREITVKRQKDGTIRLTEQKEKTIVLSRKKSSSKGYANPLDSDFTTIFRTDSACLQGYINGYPSSLGATTGMIYLNNVLTREDYPTVVNIQPNGRFKAKFKLYYPILKSWKLPNDSWFPFYIEPGQTLTLYLEWNNLKSENSLAMGPEARTNINIFETENSNPPYTHDYQDQQRILTLSPSEYAQYQLRRLKEEQENLVKYSDLNYVTPKAHHLLNNNLKIDVGYWILDYRSNREDLARQNPTNIFVKIPIDSTYYEFLQKMPLNDPSIVCCSMFEGFVNRFEFLSIFEKKYLCTYALYPFSDYLQEQNVIPDPEDIPILTHLKKMAGKTIRASITQVIEEMSFVRKPKYREHMKKYEEVVYDKKVAEMEKKKPKKETPKDTIQKTEQDISQKIINEQMEYWNYRDSIIETYLHLPPTLLQEIVKTRSLERDLNNFTKETGFSYTNELCKNFKEPFLKEITMDFYNRKQKEKDEGYELPSNKGGEIFRKIIEPFKGKYLFIDFWATTCGPCRAGIDRMASLRKKYKDSPDLQFIYITSDRESPQKGYDDYVAKNLKEETSFRISENEYNYLRELFRFNGIPRYVLINRNGHILDDDFDSYKLETTLNTLLQ